MCCSIVQPFGPGMDGVPDILADMKKAGPKQQDLNTSTQVSAPRLGLHMIHMTCQANIKPNIITYSTMLKGHCQVGAELGILMCPMLCLRNAR